ncbi:hypothetical protein ZWY2020_028766 [Hordeum vulgare]|nr:hypothetical protein ZWY2020_028766 [Hordeum vulgare]
MSRWERNLPSPGPAGDESSSARDGGGRRRHLPTPWWSIGPVSRHASPLPYVTPLARPSQRRTFAPPPAPDAASGTRAFCVWHLCGSCVSYTLWFVVQARVIKFRPSVVGHALHLRRDAAQSAQDDAVAFALVPAGDRHFNTRNSSRCEGCRWRPAP